MVVKKKLRLKIWIPVLVIGMLITGCGSGKSENKQESFGTVGKDEDPKVIMEKVFDKLEAGEGYKRTRYVKGTMPESISPQGISKMIPYDDGIISVEKSVYRNKKYYSVNMNTGLDSKSLIYLKISDHKNLNFLQLAESDDGKYKIESSEESEINSSSNMLPVESDFRYLLDGNYKPFFDIKKAEKDGNILITIYGKDLVGYLEQLHQEQKESENYMEDSDLYNIYPETKYTKSEIVYYIDKDYNLLKAESKDIIEYTPELIQESYMTQDFEYKTVNLDTDRLDSIMNDVKTGKLKKGDTIDWKLE